MTNDYKVTQRPKGESNIAAGIKIKNKHKLRISGVVLRLEAVPRGSGYGCDYRLAIVLPNDKQIEVEDVHGSVSYDELMGAIYEGATGEKPVGGENKKTYETGGLPIDIKEIIEDLSEDIIESVDPLEEKLAVLAKKEEPIIPKAASTTNQTPEPKSGKPSGNTETTSASEGLDINSLVRKQKAEVARRQAAKDFRDAEMNAGIF